MNEPIFSAILTISVSKEGYSVGENGIGYARGMIEKAMKKLSPEIIHLKIFTSLRFDCDLLLWFSFHDPGVIPRVKEGILETGLVAGFPHYYLSLYEDSPYTKEGTSLEDTLKRPSLRYLIAYPMTKTNDWYLLPYDARKKIMAEHIGMAVSHKENKDVRSYTTYSFGISDQEFVVIYETDSLTSWSHVTAKLREAEARKWINLETPILVGIRQ